MQLKAQQAKRFLDRCNQVGYRDIGISIKDDGVYLTNIPDGKGEFRVPSFITDINNKFKQEITEEEEYKQMLGRTHYTSIRFPFTPSSYALLCKGIQQDYFELIGPGLDIPSQNKVDGYGGIQVFSNTKLKQVVMRGINFTGILVYNQMFYDSKDLEVIDFGGSRLGGLSYDQMFSGCRALRKLTGLPYDSFDSAIVLTQMFESTGFEDLDIQVFNFSKVTVANRLFDNSNIHTVKIGNAFSKLKENYSSLVSIQKMFYSCSNLREIEFGETKINPLKNYNQFIYDCKNLELINLGSIEILDYDMTEQVLIGKCPSLKRLIMPKIHINKNFNLQRRFIDLTEQTNLELLDIQNMSFSNNSQVLDLLRLTPNKKIVLLVYDNNIKNLIQLHTQKFQVYTIEEFKQAKDHKA